MNQRLQESGQKEYGSKPKKKKEEKEEKIMDEFSFVLKLQRAIKQNLSCFIIECYVGRG